MKHNNIEYWQPQRRRHAESNPQASTQRRNATNIIYTLMTTEADGMC